MKIPQKLQPWVDARKRFRLSDAHIQMARELGMNPGKLGKLDNHHQELWKVPLPQFIENCYVKQFKKTRPENVLSIEQIVERENQKKRARREKKLAARETDAPTPKE